MPISAFAADITKRYFTVINRIISLPIWSLSSGSTILPLQCGFEFRCDTRGGQGDRLPSGELSGIGRFFPFLKAINAVLEAKGEVRLGGIESYQLLAGG